MQKKHWLLAGLLAMGLLIAPQTAVRAASTPAQGAKLADNRYVTVTKAYPSYASFNWRQLHTAAQLQQQTLQSTGKYVHKNGNTYLSLFDHNGTWYGYINQKAVTAANGPQGAWLAANSYTGFNTTNATTYKNFDLTKVAAAGTQLYAHTYHITGMYHTFFGATLYSLYSNTNQWMGYVNANRIKLTSAQGAWLAHQGYFTTTKAGVNIWANLNFTRSSQHYQQTFTINGAYHHFNGSTYYSLYNGRGQWVGYVSRTLGTEGNAPQGPWLKNAGKVTITAHGYPIWHSFFGNQVSTTNAYFGKTFSATGKYVHANGSTYYSLYSGSKWIGYVNAAATKPYAAYHDWLKPSQTYAYPNVNKYGSINIEANLAKQQVYIKNGNTVLYTMYCSSGANNTTPKGHFKIQNRGASFYNPTEKMGARYWTSFKDWGVYLFHSVPTNASGNYITAAAKLLGVRPDSHGCIRLSVPDAKWINTYIKAGTPVYIH